MSDQDKNLTPPGLGGGTSDPGSVAGKGWDILVGGKDNSATAGGDDPFDLVKPPLSAVEGTAGMSRDAETDSILQPGAPSGAAGVSAGVVVTPIAPPPPAAPMTPIAPARPATPMSSTIIELEGGMQAAPPPVMPQPAAAIQPAATGASGIVELAPGSAMPQPMTAPPSAIMPPAIPSVPAPRLTPAPMNVRASAPIPSIAGVTGFGLSGPFEVSDPFSTQSGLRIFDDGKQDLKPDAALEDQLVTSKRVDALWDEITETYNIVVNDVRGHFKTTGQALEDLRQARELLLAGKENFDNAEELMYGVKSRLRLEEKVRQWSRTQGVWLGTYLVLWLMLLSLGSTATTKIAELALAFKLPEWMGDTYFPALTGALGGVIGALWVLVKHTTRNRDFDPIHTLWYAANPFMGGALGVVTYFIVRGGGGLTTSVLSGGADFKMSSEVAVTLYAICIVVGFNQNILWALIDRFLKAVFPQKEEDSKAATDIRNPSPAGDESKKPQGS